MYFEEKLINAVLNYRTSPDGEWTAYTAEELTRRLVECGEIQLNR